jgi:elongation of very long chain fatty acids protein 4
MLSVVLGAKMSPFWAELDANVVNFFNPLAKDTAVRQAAKNDWPLWRMDYAVYIAFTYLAVVVTSKFLLDKGERPASTSDKKKLTVAEKIQKEGLVMFAAVAIYNLTQVILCGWMVYRALSEHRRRNFSVVCNVHDLAEDGLAFISHCFYLSKALDFVDTMFMIIKGNWRQVSFLHVYHHFSIFLFYWLNSQCNYDGDAYYSIVLNGSIHFVMYGYYFVTAFNVSVPMFIKKCITNAQLTQFCLMEAQGVALLTMNGCGASRPVTILYMVYISTMLVLFMNFKNQNYKKPAAKADATKEATPANGKATTPATKKRDSSPAPAAKEE